jgi:hypothetical protein
VSQNPDGGFVCDRCDADVGNGGVHTAVVVSRLDPQQRGQVENLHFCLDRVDADGEPVRGCEHRILSPSNVRARTERKEHGSG